MKTSLSCGKTQISHYRTIFVGSICAEQTYASLRSIVGLNAYIVNFHLRHLSGGVKDESFARGRAELIAKYGRALRPRIIKTSTAIFVLGSNGPLTRVLNTHLATRIIERVGHMLRKRK